MSTETSNNKSVFKYNMSFYYKSTIIYFIVFVLYLVIRGEFVEDSFTLVISDPVLYFLGLIVIFSIAALLYNQMLNKNIELAGNGISFINRFKERKFNIEQIVYIKLFRQKGSTRSKRMGIVRIKIEKRLRPIMFRISDYENEDDLYNKIFELKTAIENK
jgi:hypothetical protein